MKNGTLYGKRVRRVYKQLRGASSDKPPEESTDPLEQMVLAQLSWDASPTSARRALRRLTEGMIDLNEVRVSTAREIAAIIREFIPNASESARNISKSLNGVFRREARMSLDALKEKGRREARQYLESLDGVNAYVAASVLLWSLGGHAVPVNLRLLRTLRKEDLVDPSAAPAVVQTFLERHVAAAEAKAFCQAMDRLAAQKGGRPSPSTAAKPKRSPKARKKAPRAARRKKKGGRP